ncbi:Na+/H+ antiporter NhaA [Xylophilus sp.]|uniref:Na+/H+ antiporter NhaA n=1 Tax=Xylophilus sp. TaxID=2653893 RepID=UPI0013BA9C14|nr:Na+/H+ antiporter NhaA [Xylophilus sp.]KAF1045419.1 MAG: Na(+)/H(+) antiporter NhaA [Xylophilus sp.]
MSFASASGARLARILHDESAAGLALLAAAALALLWANSPWAAGYRALWHTPLPASGIDLHFGVNDGLMAVFFLAAGLEIRREIEGGALSSLRRAALPLAAAAGGVVTPALVYLACAPALPRGWAVPTATDIAFAVGVLALLGRRVPAGLRILLLALAVIDDIAAVLVIVLFYAGGFDPAGLALAALGVAMALGLQRLGAGTAWASVLPAAVLWAGLHRAGIHPGLAGVALGLLTPAAPAARIQRALQPWVAWGVMPLFALANAGVAVGSGTHGGGVLAAVMLALALGKPIGVFFATWLAVRFGGCRLPAGVGWRGVALVGLLAGIGFTMAIFIAALAFADPALQAAAKLGVLLGSLVSALLGLAWGALALRRLG